jgi:hypothetical protein
VKVKVKVLGACWLKHQLQSRRDDTRPAYPHLPRGHKVLLCHFVCHSKTHLHIYTQSAPPSVLGQRALRKRTLLHNFLLALQSTSRRLGHEKLHDKTCRRRQDQEHEERLVRGIAQQCRVLPCTRFLEVGGRETTQGNQARELLRPLGATSIFKTG